MTRVLHVTECFAGGVKRAVEAYIGVSYDHEHHLLYAGEEVPDAGTGWHSVEALPKGHIAPTMAIRAAVRRLQPDVVHVHSSWAGFHARVARLDRAVLYQPHCFKFDDPTLPGPLRWTFRVAERLLSVNTTALAVLTSHEAELARLVAPQRPVFFLENIPSIPAAPQGNPGARPRHSVVMSGRLAKQKDPDFFLRTVQELRRLDSTLQVAWLGDGEPEYRRMLERESVEVTGWLDKHQVHERLLDAVYLHSASYEGMPLSVLDAAVVDAPVVARAIPALSDLPVIMGSTPEALAAAVIAVSVPGDTQDHALSANEEIRRIYNPENLGESLAQAYREVSR